VEWRDGVEAREKRRRGKRKKGSARKERRLRREQRKRKGKACVIYISALGVVAINNVILLLSSPAERWHPVPSLAISFSFFFC
jgi:hypothetical protein